MKIGMGQITVEGGAVEANLARAEAMTLLAQGWQCDGTVVGDRRE